MPVRFSLLPVNYNGAAQASFIKILSSQKYKQTLKISCDNHFGVKHDKIITFN